MCHPFFNFSSAGAECTAIQNTGDSVQRTNRTWGLDPPGSTAAPYYGGADPAVAAVRAGTNPEFASQVRTMTGNSNTCFVNSVLHTVSALVEEARNFAALSFLLQQCLNQLQDSRPLNPIMQSLRPALASSELEVRRQATGCCGILYGTSRRQRGDLQSTTRQGRTDGLVEDADTGETPLSAPDSEQHDTSLQQLCTGSALTAGSCGKMGPRCKAADGASSESTNHAPTVDRRAEPGVAQLSSSVRTLSTKVPRLRKATIARSGSVPAAQTCRMTRLDHVSLRPQIPSRLHVLFLSKHYLKLRVGAAPETYA